MEQTSKVLSGIAKVSGALAQDGISKDRKNQQQGYSFRGIDDVLNALAPLLSAEELVVIPTVTSRECVERVTQKGGALFYVTVSVEFRIMSAADGSEVTATVYGEAMDSADKATNKAMSAAYKYWAILTFCIPTEGDNDADITTHHVAPADPKPLNKKPAKPAPAVRAGNPFGIPPEAWLKLDACKTYDELYQMCASMREDSRGANPTGENWNIGLNRFWADRSAFLKDIENNGMSSDGRPE